MAKKNSSPIVFLAGGFACVGHFRSTVKIRGAEAIKYPINMLKKSNRSLIMFPSGSRHSQDVKGGVAIIAKMAKVRIMPVTYTGPRDLKGLATGERIDMNFGHPIDISDIKKMNDEGVAEVARRIQEEFDRLDAEAQAINTPTKPLILIRLLKILLIPLVLVVAILTLLFSYLAKLCMGSGQTSEKQVKN